MKLINLLEHKDVIVGAAIASGLVGLTIATASVVGSMRGKQKAKKEANAQVPPKTVADTEVPAS